MKFNRLNDLYFKRLLGDKNKKSLTLNFLNSILNKEKDNYFTDLTFIDKDNEPEQIGGKLSKLDVRADLNDGTQIDIEVQVLPFPFMAERSLYYWSRMYADELREGEDYDHLKRAIAINLLNFNFLKDETEWHNIYHLLNTKSHQRLTDHLEIHFLEIPKFTLKDIRKMRTSETWIAYFSGKYDKKEMEVLSMENPIIKDVMDFEESFLLDKIQRREYEQREKAIKDYNSHMSERYHTGYGQGKNEGREEGRKEGRKEGIVIGKENAEKEFSALNVKLLKEKRYDDLEKASTDPVYREKLFRELHITR